MQSMCAWQKAEQCATQAGSELKLLLKTAASHPSGLKTGQCRNIPQSQSKAWQRLPLKDTLQEWKARTSCAPASVQHSELGPGMPVAPLAFFFRFPPLRAILRL